MVAILIVFSSCSKEEIVPRSKGVICLGDPERTVEYNTTHFDTLISQGFYCDIEGKGTSKLNDSSKEYMASYCLNKGDTLSFTNAANITVQYYVNSISFRENHSYSRSEIPCSLDTTNKLTFYYISQTIEVELYPVSMGFNFKIMLSTTVDRTQRSQESFGDELSIFRKRIGYSWDFQAIVNSGSLSYDSNPGQEFYESIFLNDRFFSNVLSCEVKNSSSFKYYYTEKEGLVGFVDDQNELWVLD